MTPPWLPMTPIFITESVSPKQMWMFENNQSSKSLFSTVLLQFKLRKLKYLNSFGKLDAKFVKTNFLKTFS